MKLSVFGLGYVGTVSAACLASRGHVVVGVDVSESKVNLINQGRAPIVEREISEIVRENVGANRLRATQDSHAAINDSDVSIVCVGTPSAANGGLDSRALHQVAQEIGAAIGAKSSRHTVIIRSTMLPGTFRNIILSELESASRKMATKDFGLAINPEFLREGSAVADFRNPDKTVIGSDDNMTIDTVAALYEGLPGTIVRTTPEIAEFAKYVDNIWHALKVTFGNEIGNLCKSLGIDSHDVMDIFMLDRKLNISTAYLKPGFAFGGSCLPKDTRALTYLARTKDLNLPLLQSIMPSNAAQIERAVDMVLAYVKRRIAFLGCSFKAGTDDMRESPFIILAERLIGKGCAIRIFDPNVHMSMVMGANRDYIAATIPHIGNLLVPTAQDALIDADIVVLTAASREYSTAAANLRDDQVLLDFARVSQLRTRPGYDGINW